jgi:hypothetical protein
MGISSSNISSENSGGDDTTVSLAQLSVELEEDSPRAVAPPRSTLGLEDLTPGQRENEETRVSQSSPQQVTCDSFSPESKEETAPLSAQSSPDSDFPVARDSFSPESTQATAVVSTQFGSESDSPGIVPSTKRARTQPVRLKEYISQHCQPSSAVGGIWTVEEDRILIDKFSLYGKYWDRIADHLPGRSGKDCRWRFTYDLSVAPEARENSEPDCPVTKRARKPPVYLKKYISQDCQEWSVVPGSWTDDEDCILVDKFALYGTYWDRIADHLPGRSGKDCRLRFIYDLSVAPEARENSEPDSPVTKRARKPPVHLKKYISQDCQEWFAVPGSLTHDEDCILVDKFALYGSYWDRIADHLRGRSGKDCRLRFAYDLSGVAPEERKASSKQEEESRKQKGKRARESSTQSAAKATSDEPLAKRARKAPAILNAPDASLSNWTPDEERILREKEAIGGLSFDQIAAMFLPGRTGAACKQRLRRTKAVQRKAGQSKTWQDCMRGLPWTGEEDCILREKQALGGLTWDQIAEFLPGRSRKACVARFRDHLSTGERSGRPSRIPWTQEEDHILCEKQALGNLTWNQIAELLPGRSVRASYARFHERLNKEQNGFSNRTQWTQEEDKVLCEEVSLGLDWDQIARFFPGRSGNACWLRFNGHLKKGQESLRTSSRVSSATSGPKKAKPSMNPSPKTKKHVRKRNDILEIPFEKRRSNKKTKPRWPPEDLKIALAFFRKCK